MNYVCPPEFSIIIKGLEHLLICQSVWALEVTSQQLLSMMGATLGTWDLYEEVKWKQSSSRDIFVIHRLPFVNRWLMIESN